MSPLLPGAPAHPIRALPAEPPRAGGGRAWQREMERAQAATSAQASAPGTDRPAGANDAPSPHGAVDALPAAGPSAIGGVGAVVTRMFGPVACAPAPSFPAATVAAGGLAPAPALLRAAWPAAAAASPARSLGFSAPPHAEGGPRIHVDQGPCGLQVWLGIDGDEAQVMARTAIIVAELRRAPVFAGQRLASVVCNGATVYALAAPTHAFHRQEP